ncbi:GWxTD domain-containing protein [Tunturiibacter gelidoferens]|uniref:GWxTD domain-containing protein n=3 Tax=Tunturiibacter TaxID=3154218 RepID=A0A7Y9NNC7_9BACT|nr:GWxTD domain-containing protein [Edaphobacter lichenicola]MBB5338176.1 GWxTD domain-containing protein [Edaphobacter lichenicola]NYF52570.1 GWxTD domain-containing protein [Edaphobacter lichenicola]
MTTSRRLVSSTTLFLLILMGGHVLTAQEAPSDSAQADGVTKGPVTVEKPDPLKRPLSDKEKRDQQKALKAELKGVYKKWVDEDVRWIITDQELQAFKSLSNDEERDQFIENFWLRRNPNPDSPENEFREEHYARIAYSNDHFAAGKPGWRTDRGHIYIAYGKPDNIDSHPSGGSYERPVEEGGGNTSTFPFEIWHYRYLAGIGDNVDIEFVDTCMCGDYHMTIDRSEKDALKHTPGAGQTLYEQTGQSKQADRFSGGGLEQLGAGPLSSQNQSKQFDRLDRFAKLMAPPEIKFKDMESFMTTSKILTGPPFLFDVRTDYVKVTNDTILVPVTLQIKNGDITFTNKDGVAMGTVNILGRVSNLNHKAIQTFEDTVSVQVPSELLARKRTDQSVYWKSLPLRPGLYKIDIVIKDVNNPDHIGRWQRSLNVPAYDDDRLASSSLILASSMERVPSKDIGAGNFIIGDTHITPRVPTGIGVPVTFHRAQNLNFWMQVYNLGIDEKSKQNGATIEYQILDVATNKSILETQELTSKTNPNADQVTIEKSLPLASLQPGKYQVNIKVNDGITKQQIAESAPFNVD